MGNSNLLKDHEFKGHVADLKIELGLAGYEYFRILIEGYHFAGEHRMTVELWTKESTGEVFQLIIYHEMHGVDFFKQVKIEGFESTEGGN